MRALRLVSILTAAVMLGSCTVDWKDNYTYGGQTRTDAELAYDSSVRVAALLQACGTAECLSMKAKVQDIGSRLIQHVNATTVGSSIQSWYTKQDQLLEEYTVVKRDAYLVLVDSGWAAPPGTNGTGDWDATWWDFSSP